MIECLMSRSQWSDKLSVESAGFRSGAESSAAVGTIMRLVFELISIRTHLFLLENQQSCGMNERRSEMRRLLVILILLIGGLSLTSFAQQPQPRYALFPEFFSGSGWICEIFFTNQDIVGLWGIEIAFYDKDGLPVSVDSNLGTATSYSFNLGPGATQVIQVNPEAAYVEGYAVITYPPPGGAPVRATLAFRYVDDEGDVTVEAGVPQQEYGYHYSFPVEVNSSQEIYTAVAIVNPEIYVSEDQVIIINLIGTDGTLLATTSMLLGPGEHFAGYLSEPQLFPGLGDTIGSISISSPFGVGVLALRQDKGAFGAISTDGGPNLGPFALDNIAIGEIEPNDDDLNAQHLAGSIKISGVIGITGDEDFFSFTGQAGDVVSVICDAQLDGSWLDSVLEIYDGSLNKIAFNDQNGLAPELYPVNDSFIQVELPANDTYFMRLRDYFGEGGPEYHYTLHVRITPGN